MVVRGGAALASGAGAGGRRAATDPIAAGAEAGRMGGSGAACVGTGATARGGSGRAAVDTAGGGAAAAIGPAWAASSATLAIILVESNGLSKLPSAPTVAP